MPRANSHIRMSSEQARGDSLRRQVERSEQFAARELSRVEDRGDPGDADAAGDE